jgi:hypothetical protein
MTRPWSQYANPDQYLAVPENRLPRLLDLGDFTRFAADLTGVDWFDVHVPPGTPAPQTPELIPPGHYITGFQPGNSPPGPADIILRVAHCTDPDGLDITGTVARHVATALRWQRYGVEFSRVPWLPLLRRVHIIDNATERVVSQNTGVGVFGLMAWVDTEIERLTDGPSVGAA